MARKNRTKSAIPDAPEYSPTPKKGAAPKKSTAADNFAISREFIESVAIAIVLALLFRAFEAEAFVIPTGSMAPTLFGRHKDVLDPETNYEYHVGASDEVNSQTGQVIEGRSLIGTIDPLYHTVQNIEDLPSYPGDRILVSKFAYEFFAPKRWDVIVFKQPQEPNVNYIKRLIGLPGETVHIWHGDIYVSEDPEDEVGKIARKPPRKQLTLLQTVYDSDYPNPDLEEAGFPDRFEPYPLSNTAWRKTSDEYTYACTPSGGEIDWLRYRNIFPGSSDWNSAKHGQKVNAQRARDDDSSLITDFNVYNAASYAGTPGLPARDYGMHWVGDLALEADLNIASKTGEIILELVEGRHKFRCTFDVATSEATLSIVGEQITFDAADGKPITAATAVRGPGQHSVRFANCDDELRLWVDDSLITFSAPATFVSPRTLNPFWSEEDPGDLLPAGIGSRGAALSAKSLRIKRDVYYIADSTQTRRGRPETILDYHTANERPTENMILEIMRSPSQWSTTDIFDMRAQVSFTMEEDQYFPMGDNSAASFDGRLWPIGEQYVPGDLLIGKALFVYWPHSTHNPVPYFPNFRRMKFIE
ncbi:signal peptidase I [Blastopirellula sp. J2-11]|uniref:signal peptidase I n=1 Tax=Blastopirellula sp. J2-11 TaxID=2943192 RepID=UPI002905A7C9|nr:signal peptidase I [Blastopirellula sp. J2-11]